MINVVKKLYTFMEENHPKKMKLIKYVISGGTAAVVDLSLLFVFTDLLHIWYILSAILAFMFAFVVSFILQKYWTFGDRSNGNVKTQAMKYFVVTTTNLGLNTLFVFIFVHYAGFHYMTAQFVTGALIAVESFFVYHIIFKKSQTDEIGDMTLDMKRVNI